MFLAECVMTVVVCMYMYGMQEVEHHHFTHTGINW